MRKHANQLALFDEKGSQEDASSPRQKPREEWLRDEDGNPVAPGSMDEFYVMHPELTDEFRYKHKTYGPEPFRLWLHDALRRLRGKSENPWTPERARFYRFCFVERCKWLPVEEGKPLREAFEQEWDRLGIVQSELKQPSRYYEDD